jgi:tetratricopeptide (TPR) repeat protein
MKNKITIIAVLFLATMFTHAQEKEAAEKLISAGVAEHDKGDFRLAIFNYDKALELDKDNLVALSEKALSLISMKKYDEAIEQCKRAIAVHPGEAGLANAFVSFGTALDGLKKSDEALTIYDEGIKQFPKYYPLHFNKGITLSMTQQYDEAILSFHNSLLLNPNHAGSHNALGRILNMQGKRIPALMAYCRFLAIEPKSDRAKENLQGLQSIMKGSAKETGKNSTTIFITPEMLSGAKDDGKSKENDFASTDLVLAMTSAMDNDKKNKKKTEVENFIRKMETVCSLLEETNQKNHGFYWEFYAPYFVVMKKNKFVEVFSYIAFTSSEEDYVEGWLASHANEVDKFLEWSKGFEWKVK